jgi:cytochrome c oxidase subunit 4
MAEQSETHDAHDHHPGVGQYVEIGAILAMLTAIEVALFYAKLATAIVIPTLLFLTAMKFVLVILWFMHLRFDHRVFRRLFFTGIALAAFVFSIVLVVSG